MISSTTNGGWAPASVAFPSAVQYAASTLKGKSASDAENEGSQGTINENELAATTGNAYDTADAVRENPPDGVDVSKEDKQAEEIAVLRAVRRAKLLPCK